MMRFCEKTPFGHDEYFRPHELLSAKTLHSGRKCDCVICREPQPGCLLIKFINGSIVLSGMFLTQMMVW
ncbi:hypothetical protein SRHO_G00316050 [Serrasalmus rhombeus]